MKKIILFICVVLFTLKAKADIRLPHVLASNMVLQQNASAKLWGWASPTEKIKITTSWDNKTIETKANGNANWQVEVQTPKAGGPYTITFKGANHIVLDNVLIGEVWVCSGQSNMEWSYNSGIKSIKDEFAQLSKLNIRLFHIPKTTSATPQDDCSASWATLDSNVLKSFSAVGYYFGKTINQNLNVPIGLINSNWGGTPAEVWTPAEMVNADSGLKQSATKNEPTVWWPVKPGVAYNAMIAPLINYAIAGTIWYQGESNIFAPSTYAQLMDSLVTGWRKNWKKDFPFYFVQIAPHKYPTPNAKALVREAQTKNLQLRNSGMVVISDLVDDTLNIHPNNKKDVGLRLANLALGDTYGKNIKGYKSPLFKAVAIKNNKAIIAFENAQSGLKIDGKQAKEIFIAGNDKVFYEARVKIEKNTLIVWNDRVKNPVAVRYQFSNAGIGNIFSKDGLPVAPFRADGW